MTNVIITGGTGTIGTRLSNLLIKRGYNVIIFTRNISNKKPDKISYVHWDVDKGIIDRESIENADYIINLAGASVAEKSWTEERKKLILESREKAGALLVKALTEIPNKVKAVVSASASGYYGPDNLLSLNDGFTEDDPAGTDFLAAVCKQWEESIEPVTELGKRLVILRTGLVMSKKGGAYKEFTKPLKYRVAAVLGNGRQMQSWIHEDDICNMYLFAIENEKLSGAYNAVAPQPVNNKTLIFSIARACHKFFIPVFVPRFVINIMLGELATEVLKSANLSAKKIEQAGFSFMYPEIMEAAEDLSNR
ncbi:TIGR01777 family protein [Taibaiella lutea]|uniref:TIGR01777 family protein n=1 Tax=Taibaiella lutea TaxID=2608001 RepID=A0A5M6CBU2_9BACT|nr:TIGR01777 family oxidoreductase [Taibaiella lutea]KAA5532463.1 TIGR01777 family protein [Taibaiella lutea]